jgi:LysM repeat protein
MAVACSIESYLDRMGVPSNERLRSVIYVVTMVGERPMAAMLCGVQDGKTGSIRTPSALPPARLTRRGRVLVTGVSALLVGVLSVALATAAQAAHAGSATPDRYVARVQVLPGQSLWSLAEEYDPHADARATVEQIRQLNSMAGDQIQAGAVLWVPRD